MNARTIGFLGFGEVGSTLARDLLRHGPVEVTAWDRLFPEPDSLPSRRFRSLKDEQTETTRLRQASGPQFSGVNLIISAVTAAQDLPAARSVAPHLRPGDWFFDLNSAAPATRHDAAAIVQATGARYVEGAVMSPIAPKSCASPILIGGPHAEEFAPIAHALGFSALSFVGDEIGLAAAIKMCRSVVVKGIEALITEALLAARHYGVDGAVIESLNDVLPDPDLRSQAQYMISRSLQHGARRAEEMREAARTVREAGLQSWMSEACTLRQAWAGRLGEQTSGDHLAATLDAIHRQMEEREAIT